MREEINFANIKHTCAFTGNRPKSLPWGENEQDERCIKLKEQLIKEIQTTITSGYTHFLTGMAQGFDTYAAEAVIEIMKTNKNITLEAIIPHANQEKNWSDQAKARYAEILNNCTKTQTLRPHYTKACMHTRNRYLVDNSSLLIALSTQEKGGTAEAIKYAQKKGVKSVIL